MKNLEKLHDVEYNHAASAGSSANHRLYLIASFQEIVDALGNPSIVGSGDNKVQIEWVFYSSGVTEQHMVITVYDYKKRTSIFNIYEWNIGSKNLTEEEVILFLEEKGLKSNIRKLNTADGNWRLEAIN